MCSCLMNPCATLCGNWKLETGNCKQDKQSQHDLPCMPTSFLYFESVRIIDPSTAERVRPAGTLAVRLARQGQHCIESPLCTIAQHQRAPMRHRDALRNGQPQPGPVGLVRLRAKIRFEHSLEHVLPC